MGKQALGRGLSAIFGAHGVSNNPINNPVENTAAEVDNKKIVDIDVSLIDANPYQPRKVFDDTGLAELSDSIKEHGLIQPIVLRKVGNRYQIISGERRTRATRLAGLPTIKAQVYDNIDDKAMAEWALIENIQRVDLNPVEIARSYQQLIDNHGYTHEDLSKIVSKSRSAITNSLRLLKLPEQVLLWIEEGKIAGGAARALCSDKVEDPEALAKRVIDEGLNVRQIEAIARGEDINQPRDEKRETEDDVDKQPADATATGANPSIPIKPTGPARISTVPSSRTSATANGHTRPPSIPRKPEPSVMATSVRSSQRMTGSVTQ